MKDTKSKGIVKVLAGAMLGIFCSVPLTGRITSWHYIDSMQRRQDCIIEAMNQNPLTRTSDTEQFRQVYETEEKAYDSGITISLARDYASQRENLRRLNEK